MTTTTTTVEQQVQELIGLVNNQWKVNRIESGHSFYPELSYTIGKKYIKVMNSSVYQTHVNSNGVFMFVDKNTGECYKPASFRAPAKIVRYMMTELLKDPEMVDPYGSFLYLN